MSWSDRGRLTAGQGRRQAMADVFTRGKRSEVMAAIRSKGNRDTEICLASVLRKAGIKGWRRHMPLAGKPDFVFREQRVAVFVDGCFWPSGGRAGSAFVGGQQHARDASYDLERSERTLSVSPVPPPDFFQSQRGEWLASSMHRPPGAVRAARATVPHRAQGWVSSERDRRATSLGTSRSYLVNRAAEWLGGVGGRRRGPQCRGCCASGCLAGVECNRSPILGPGPKTRRTLGLPTLFSCQAAVACEYEGRDVFRELPQ